MVLAYTFPCSHLHRKCSHSVHQQYIIIKLTDCARIILTQADVDFSFSIKPSAPNDVHDVNCTIRKKKLITRLTDVHRFSFQPGKLASAHQIQRKKCVRASCIFSKRVHNTNICGTPSWQIEHILKTTSSALLLCLSSKFPSKFIRMCVYFCKSYQNRIYTSDINH